jgi:type IV secretion system protein VirB4
MSILSAIKKYTSKTANLIEDIIVLRKINPEFIPYACYYNPHTILTKNSELLQTIRIPGFSQDLADKGIMDLRSIIKDSLTKNINNNDLAVWIHTIRKRSDIDTAHPEDYTLDFPRETHTAWRKKNYWHDKYANELYITILHHSPPMQLRGLKDIVKSFSFRAQKSKHKSFLKNASHVLTKVTNTILEDLKPYGATLLGNNLEKDGLYSDYLKFFNQFFYFPVRKRLLPYVDLSQSFSDIRMAFGSHEIEFMDEEDKPLFATILSIKEYHYINPKLLDDILQLPQQMIFTESFTFADPRLISQHLEYHDNILKISKDTEFRKLSNIDNLIQIGRHDHFKIVDQQLTIMLVSETLNKLYVELRRLNESLNDLGLIIVHEDIQLENCFWSQLPGNFSFRTRKVPVHIDHITGFATLHYFNFGQLSSPWGGAITLFRTISGTPYYFNFHHKGIGHTVITGPASSGKATFMHFLISESFKLNPILFYLDHHHHAKNFIEALEGTYQEASKINPFTLENNSENRGFLMDWLTLLIHESAATTEENLAQLNSIIDQLYNLPVDQRDLSIFFEDENIKQKIAHVIDPQANDTLSPVFALNCSDLLQDKKQAKLIIYYWMHKFLSELRGQATIIVLKDFLFDIDESFFNSHLAPWLQKLTARNAIALFSIDLTVGNRFNSPLAKTIIDNTVTQMLLPDAPNTYLYKTLFSLDENHAYNFRTMRKINRHFMLKQANDVLVAEVSLAGLDPSLKVLSFVEG